MNSKNYYKLGAAKPISACKQMGEITVVNYLNWVLINGTTCNKELKKTIWNSLVGVVCT